MNTLFAGQSFIRFTLSCAVIGAIVLGSVPTGFAQGHEDRHTRKIHRKLSKYPEGSYLHLVLHDSTNNYGALGTVSDASFTFRNSETNEMATIPYIDVSSIKTDREPIGEGSEHRHYFRTRTYVIAGVLVAGAAVAAVEVR